MGNKDEIISRTCMHGTALLWDSIQTCLKHGWYLTKAALRCIAKSSKTTYCMALLLKWLAWSCRECGGKLMHLNYEGVYVWPDFGESDLMSHWNIQNYTIQCVNSNEGYKTFKAFHIFIVIQGENYKINSDQWKVYRMSILLIVVINIWGVKCVLKTDFI